ncbi:hypothetical protein [Arcobacter ellisii]|uniref:AsmA family protein (DUF3971 domain) n=1 Tax=Arcobacter ellisii TaxID=913109 RepID=A0A347UA99_9BACT|nr:hypothetical protein [Arcobacter ellisii]AXX95777.1 hypothetical protein AELL_2136 [Arcobacter ellisii]RXI29119.1 hypothetical protein CP962_12095 [Arcobacter ellisii]
MQKLFFSLTILIILIIGSIYGILFTKYGNSIISSYIESKVNNEQEKVKLKVNNFILTLKTIDFNAVINDDSYINISGDLSIFKKSVDLKYDIKIENLSTLKNLIHQDLKGKFYTNGIFKGNKQEAIIQGFSNLASSQTKYYINLNKFEINNIQLDLKEAKIEELLSLINKPEYLKGTLNINANIKNIDINNLDGIFVANMTKGILNNDVINKEFNQTLSSPINFQGDINASLLGNKAEVKSELLTSIADIFLDKTIIDLNNKNFFSDYKIDVKNLNRLEGVLGRKLNAEFSNIGKVSMENSLISINGNSNIFESTTNYKLELKDFVAQNVDFKIENAKIEKLLHMLNEPVYLIGDFNVKGQIKDSSLDKLNGLIVSKISNAKIINEVVNAVYKQELTDVITFDSTINTSLVPNQAISKVEVLSNIGKLNLEKAIYNLSDKSFNSDYVLNILALEKIKGLTKSDLRGELDLKGEVKSLDKNLFLTGNSNIVGGTLNFNLKNDIFNLKLDNANMKDLLYKMNKPEIFDSKANFDLQYDLAIKKGKLNANLLNGHFLPNDYSNIISQLAKFDLTKEIYETVKIESNINEKQFVSNLNMQSKNTQIQADDAFLDFDKNLIDAKLNTKIKDNNFVITLKGDMKKPNIGLDTKELLKNEVEKNRDKIEEKLNKVLDEKIKDEKTKDIINNLKNIF